VREAGGVAWGRAGDVARGSINLGQWPAAHQLSHFFESTVNVVVGLVLWR